jgi:hypothetical protein
MIDLLSKFKKFDPLVDPTTEIPSCKGNYIVTLKINSKLPTTKIAFCCSKIEEKEILYTGISNKSLRSRDYKQHFNGTAGNSTLRKSIGSLFGWKKIPRDKTPNGKTKFNLTDENTLSDWMKKNLELYYYPNLNPDEFESFLINKLNPPLNLSKNKNIINTEFRTELSNLRK